MATILTSRPTCNWLPPFLVSSQKNDAVASQTDTRSLSSSSMRNSVLAGYSAGAFGVVVGQPLDCLKVYAQTQSVASAHPSTALLPTSAFTRLRALYAGIQGPLVLVGMVQSINFVTYDSLRQILYQDQAERGRITGGHHRNKDPLLNVVVAASATGSLISVLTSPFLVIKTRQQLYQQGFREALTNLGGGGGLRCFYAGFGPHWVTETLGRAVYFGMYESLKRMRMAQQLESTSSGNPRQKQATLTLPERMLYAGVAGMTSCMVVYPFDTLKSRIYAALLPPGAGHSPPPINWQRTTATNSLRALYRGFGVTILRAGPVSAAILPLYDVAMEYLASISS